MEKITRLHSLVDSFGLEFRKMDVLSSNITNQCPYQWHHVLWSEEKKKEKNCYNSAEDTMNSNKDWDISAQTQLSL